VRTWCLPRWCGRRNGITGGTRRRGAALSGDRTSPTDAIGKPRRSPARALIRTECGSEQRRTNRGNLRKVILRPAGQS
jgi:hypothetical protein